MKPHETPAWNPLYPERYPWKTLDNPKLAKVANDIAERIVYDLRTCPTRNNVPGLRLALCILANLADI